MRYKLRHIDRTGVEKLGGFSLKLYRSTLASPGTRLREEENATTAPNQVLSRGRSARVGLWLRPPGPALVRPSGFLLRARGSSDRDQSQTGSTPLCVDPYDLSAFVESRF